MIRVLAPFVPLFSKRVWRHAQVLLWRGRYSLSGQKRPVTAAYRVMDLGRSKQFHSYHHALDLAAGFVSQPR